MSGVEDADDPTGFTVELARCELFADVAPPELEHLAALMRPVTADTGTVLVRQGDRARHFLLLTAGTVRVAFGDEANHEPVLVGPGSVLGEIGLLRRGRHGATVTAETDVRGLVGGKAAFTWLLALPGVGDRLVTRARRRLAAGLIPVPATLRDGRRLALRPVLPDDRRRLLQAGALVSRQTLYTRFFTGGEPSAETARILTEVDYVDHFVWVALDDEDIAIGGVSYFRSVSDPDTADVSFSIMDGFQGRGLGTLLMGAIAVAARRNGVVRFSADVLVANAPMLAILDRAGTRWSPEECGAVHGTTDVPDPAEFGIGAGTAAALDLLVRQVGLRAGRSPLALPRPEPRFDGRNDTAGG